VGALIIWTEEVSKERTGHVAVITDMTDTEVRIAEQNWADEFWPPEQDYSRRLKLRNDAGKYSIEDPHLLGWIIVDSPEQI